MDKRKRDASASASNHSDESDGAPRPARKKGVAAGASKAAAEAMSRSAGARRMSDSDEEQAPAPKKRKATTAAVAAELPGASAAAAAAAAAAEAGPADAGSSDGEAVMDEEVSDENALRMTEVDAEEFENKLANIRLTAIRQLQVNEELDSMDVVGEKGKSGTLLEVVLVEFMHFAHHRVAFGPFVNFIVGANGSGKSCVLTGICCALGMNAKRTDRASNLGELIRNRGPKATVSVTLRNHGPDGFQMDAFGDWIKVTRTLTRAGTGDGVSSTYKIESDGGAKFSGADATQKLKEMLIYFNIDLGNPYCVLNQTMAKRFVNGSPEDYFKFYMEGTQLASVKALIHDGQELMVRTDGIMAVKRADCEKLKVQAAETKAKLKAMADAVRLQESLRIAKAHLQWSIAALQESDRRQLARQVEDARVAYDAAMKEHTAVMAGQDGSRAELAEVSQRMTEANERLNDAVVASAECRKELDSKTREAEAKERMHAKASGQVNALRGKIAELERQVEIARKAQLDNQSEVKAAAERRAQELTERRAAEAALRDEADAVAVRLEAIEGEALQFHRVKSKAQSDLVAAEEQLARTAAQHASLASGTTASTVAQFGGPTAVSLVRVFEERAARFSAAPIGPVGSTLRLRDRRWGPAIGELLGRLNSAFLVATKADLVEAQHVCDGLKINVRDRPMFVVQAFRDVLVDPRAPEYAGTILAVVDAPAPVLNVLLTMRSIDRHVLCETDDEALAVLKRTADITAWLPDGTDIKMKDGSIRHHYATRDHTNSYGVDNAEAARRVEERLPALQDAVVRARAEAERVAGGEHKFTSEKSKLRAREKTLKDQAARIQREIAALATEIDDDVADRVAPILVQVTRAQEQLRKAEEDEAHSAQVCAVLRAKITPIAEEMAVQGLKVNELTAEAKALSDTISRLSRGINSARSERSRVQMAVKETEAALATLARNQAKNEAAYQASVAKAEASAPRPATLLSSKSYENEIDQISAKLIAERESKGDERQLKRVMADLKARIAALEGQMEAHSINRDSLEKALTHRNQVVKGMEKLLSARLQVRFKKVLEVRRLHGKLDLDTEASRIECQFTAADKDATARGARELSGGERSFMTTAFIIALWQVVQLPFGALDEFDVYMDVAARAIALSLLTQSAIASKFQTLFLVNDVSDLDKTNPQVCITLMPQPQRSADAGPA